MTREPKLSGASRLLVAGCILVVLIGIFYWPRGDEASSDRGATNDLGSSEAGNGAASKQFGRVPRRSSPAAAPPTADEIVWGKVNQFGRTRRELAREMGRRAGKDVPSDVEKFFDAIESGHWEEIEARWSALSKQSGQYDGSTHREELDPFWPAVLDAYGVGEQAHLWPAQKLLDYGNRILDSLRPGMIYVGGTDNGRWIPELLNETSGAEPHMIVTQNAFADGRYLDFMQTLYGDRLATLTHDDSQRAFQEYIGDAQKRLEHDEKFPDEPKQVRPGENIKVVEGRVQVSGQVAVMAINEKLLQMLMEKNPGLGFAMQESFPMTGTYADAAPLGPIMELRAPEGQNAFTAERAAQTLDYWRNAAQQILADPGVGAGDSTAVFKSYSHDAVAAANLLAAHNYIAEAEQGYRLAAQIWPENPETIGGLAQLLARGGREAEARQMLEEFGRQHPAQRKDAERISAAWRATAPAESAKP